MILKTVLPKETAHATMSETEVAEMESNVSPFLRLRLLQDAELEPSVRRHSPPPPHRIPPAPISQPMPFHPTWTRSHLRRVIDMLGSGSRLRRFYRANS